MAITVRKGLEIDFDPNKMLTGELAVTLEGKMFYCTAPGVVEEVITKEDFQALFESIEDAIEQAQLAVDLVNNIVASKIGINDLAPSISETYSSTKIETLITMVKAYTDGKFGEITSFKVSVVATRPTVGEANVIYFVQRSPEDENEFDEYMYINDKWEILGGITIDLSNFYTKDEIDTMIENIPSSGEIEVNVKYPPIPMIGAKGDGTTDDAVALQNILNLGRALYWPKGTYLTSATLRPKHASTNWRGESWTSTILKLVTDGIELIKGIDTLPVDGVTYSPTYAKIENMQFVGLGSSHGQIGLDLKGYMYTLDRLIITGFNQAAKIAGVFVYLDNMYIHNNNHGILLQIDDSETSSYIMTMIRLYKVSFMLNTGVCISNNNGAKGYPNIINLIMDGCGFEQSGKAFELDSKVQELLIENCWFESNTTRPTTPKMNMTLINNHYNSPDQYINYISLASGIYAQGTGGATNLQSQGIANFKQYVFQLFNNDTITDNAKMSLYENIKGSSHFLEAKDNTVKTGMARVGIGSNSIYDITYNIFVNNDGTVTHDCPFTVTVTKPATGTYSLVFGEEIRKPVINITCANATSFDTTKRLVPNVYLTSTLDGGNYNSYQLVNKITVYCEDLAASNALTDSRLMITIRPNRV